MVSPSERATTRPWITRDSPAWAPLAARAAIVTAMQISPFGVLRRAIERISCSRRSDSLGGDEHREYRKLQRTFRVKCPCACRRRLHDRGDFTSDQRTNGIAVGGARENYSRQTSNATPTGATPTGPTRPARRA